LSNKPTNPKDIVGTDKVPLHLWPGTASVLGSMALMDGAMKYGRTNWRVAGVRYSIYMDAAMRHMQKAFEGEELDPDSGLPHEAHALACIAIIVDARYAGKLVDDRAYPGGFAAALEDMTPHVAEIRERYKDRNPKHYTIEDRED
jgi:dATP/dGTP diphosphohydrolase, N-terminal